MIPSLYTIKSILILNSDGSRLVGKYYDQTFGSVKEQKDFEKSLFAKTNKANGEIIMIDNLTIVYRSSIDLFFYVVGSTAENEIMLVSVLNCLFDSLCLMLRKNVEKKTLMDNLDSVLLMVDEICDSGIILEMDAAQICQRVCVRADDALPFSEQTVVDVLKAILK